MGVVIQIVEISVYLLLIGFFSSYRHILSGRKNGCFYHKNDKVLPPFLEKAIHNIHFLETPAWFCVSIVAFFSTLAMQRFGYWSPELWTIVAQIGISLLFMTGTYHMPSYHFQRGITAGLKDDDHLDAINESEVAIMIFGKKIQFWKGRLFSNRRRKLAQWLGVIEILTAVGLLIWFNLIHKSNLLLPY